MYFVHIILVYFNTTSSHLIKACEINLSVDCAVKHKITFAKPKTPPKHLKHQATQTLSKNQDPDQFQKIYLLFQHHAPNQYHDGPSHHL